jgi:hypothetical protein
VIWKRFYRQRSQATRYICVVMLPCLPVEKRNNAAASTETADGEQRSGLRLNTPLQPTPLRVDKIGAILSVRIS